MPNIGPLELIIVLVIVLVIFGPKRLPGIGKQLGGGIRDFKEAVSSSHGDDEDETPDDGRVLTAGEADAPPAVPAAKRTAEPEDVAKRTGLDA